MMKKLFISLTVLGVIVSMSAVNAGPIINTLNRAAQVEQSVENSRQQAQERSAQRQQTYENKKQELKQQQQAQKQQREAQTQKKKEALNTLLGK